MTKNISIPVLEGYIRLIDHMGTDLTVVNSARVSFNKDSDIFTDKDRKLIRYLLKNGHLSPLRHAMLTFEIKAPMVVARQWFKYRVGSVHTGEELAFPGDEDSHDLMYARNEISGRYVEMSQFYAPKIWRKQSKSNKQGSEGPVTVKINEEMTKELKELTTISTYLYEKAIKLGICREQARLFLPYFGVYTMWRWTASLHGVLHFLTQRTDDHAQWEIRQYAEVIKQLTREIFPESISAWEECKPIFN
jgi:thymidylate synthase, flavin-dependent